MKLQQTIQKFSRYLTPVPRCKELLDLEGTVVAKIISFGESCTEKYKLSDTCNAFDWNYHNVVKTKATPKGESIFKFLAKHSKYWSQDKIQTLQNSLVTTEYPLTLSCRYTDILRCSITRHFESCYAPGGCYSQTPYELLGKSNVAICVNRDKSGMFIARAFVQYNFRTRNFTFGRPYTNNKHPILETELPVNPEEFTPFDK